MFRFMLALVLAAALPLTPASAASPPLVDVVWLAKSACAADVRVLDVQTAIDRDQAADFDPAADYRAGHVPCAVFTDYLLGGWRTRVGDVIAQLPGAAQLEQLIGDLGIHNDTHVVIYHRGETALDAAAAARVYFTFKAAGHDRVSILDGGFAAWAAGRADALETGEVIPEPEIFTAEMRPELLADSGHVAALIDMPGSLIDFRPPEQYVGDQRHPAATRAGTVPGAVNIPETTLLADDGTFLTGDELGQRFAPAAGDAVAFCNTGHWAALGWFAASELLGRDGIRIYDGSMVEWSADQDRPMVRERYARR